MFGKKKNTFALVTGVSMAALGAAEAAAQEARVSDEIIVTAQKREENIQDVPIAVTALGGEQLQQAGIADIRALQTLSASINLNSSQTESGGTTLRIRGVGTTGNNAGLESAVGVFIDGVYAARPSIALGELLDVQQVEILRGPQGTLFGRNTSAGALLITTRAPSFDAVGGFGNLTIGSFNQGDFPALVSTQAGINVPVIQDVLAFRLSGAARVRDGLLTSADGGIEQNSRDRYQVRGQALFAPTDDVSLRVILDYAEGNDDCCDAVVLGESAIRPFYAISGTPANGGVIAFGARALETRTSNSQQFKDPGEQTGITAQLDWSLPFGDLTYIGATRNSISGPNIQESDFVALNVFTVGGVGAPIETTGDANSARLNYDSHELRLAGEVGRLQWLVGAYYGEESILTQGALSLGADFQRNLNANLYAGLAAALGATPATVVATATAAFTPALGAMGAAAFAANPAAFFAGGASSTGAYAFNKFTQQGETLSFFTHNTLSLTDQLDLTVGIRYVEESKDGVFQQLGVSGQQACLNAVATQAALAATPLAALAAGARGALCFPFAAPTGSVSSGLPVPFNRTFEDEELVWTANASYAFTPDVRGYASITHGFKSGGFNLDPTAGAGGADPRFKSEIVDSYEVGLKTEIFDGRARANFAVFHSDIQDFQVLEFTGVQFQTFNVPSVKASGAELEVDASLSDHWGSTLAVTYSDARYPSDCAKGLPAATNPLVTETADIVGTLCGSSLTNAPEWVTIFGLNYDAPVGANHRFYGSGSVRYETDRRTSTQPFVVNANAPLRTTPTPLDIQGANAKANLRFGYGAADESWAVEIWGTNIFDEQTRNVTINVPLRGSGASAARGVFIEEPAMFGATIRANF